MLQLSIAISSYGHAAALKDGSVAIAGVAPRFVEFANMVEAFRRMVREVAFDVCELAPTTYFAARLGGAPYVALPIFQLRHFHHGGLLCRRDAGIGTPRDLAGKRVGVRAWSVTSGVWARGILADEYGLDLSRVTWVVADDDHVATLRPPPNVVRAPAGRALADMLIDGELHAAFSGAPGIGKVPAARLAACRELFADAGALEADWYRRTGIYPIHGLIVVKDALLAAHPRLERALMTAFGESKRRYVRRLDAGEARSAADDRYRALAAIVGDPLPYGIAANRPAIEALIDYSHRQGLLARRPALEELFLDPAPA
jgi:4,5-dihydroxyphthalate decarboxylase